MAYEIKPPLWGIKPGKRETRQRVATGANLGIPGYYSTVLKKQIIDIASQTFISPSMQVRDFAPFISGCIVRFVKTT